MKENIRLVKRFGEANYSFTEIEVTRTVEEGNTGNELLTLEAEIVSAYNKEIPTSVKEDQPENTPETAPAKEEDVNKTEVEEVNEDPKKVTKKAKKKVTKKTTKKAPKKSDCVPYDRMIKEHKDELATILADKYPNWKKSKVTVAKAKALSEALNGEDMFGPSGDVLESFVDLVVKGMGEFEEAAEL